MQSQQLGAVLYTLLWSAAPIVLVPLVLATILGFLIALMQAVTQTQEQTLPQSVKMVVVAATLLVFGAPLAMPFYRASIALFDNFWTYNR